jgi:hypothetical protein
MDWKLLGPYIVPVLVVALLARRLIRNTPRKVKTSRMFVLPGIVAIATVMTLYSTGVPGVLWIGVYAVALIAGAAVGFLSAHHQEFALDYETGEITSKATPIGSALVVALFGMRFVLKLIMPSVAGSPTAITSYTPGSPLPQVPAHATGALLGWTDAGIIFSAAMMLARAATTYLRAQPLLAEHKAHLALKAAGSDPGVQPPP